jgi:hypothetical protein
VSGLPHRVVSSGRVHFPGGLSVPQRMMIGDIVLHLTKRLP